MKQGRIGLIRETQGALIFKAAIISQLKKATNLPESQISPLLEIPPEPHLGDYSFPCFDLARSLQQSPAAIASHILTKLSPNKYIEKFEQKGPYINFFLNQETLTALTIREILSNKQYGKSKNKKQRILIEYPSPNTNKPLHLGHIRNMLLGSTLASLLKFQGHQVFSSSLNNDRGIHICKSMLAYKLFSNNQPPNKKPDHFVGDFYVLFAKKAAEQPELEQQAQEMLVKWEQQDAETRKLWKKMNSWALQGFQQTYATFNLKFSKQYHESQLYKKGKSLILAAHKKGILQKDEKGNIIADLSQYNLGKKVVLRADGTSIYITQDLFLAYQKERDFHPSSSIYVVASEQNHHFKALFAILKLLNFKKAPSLHHFSYGMVYLPEGRMKSREGTVVDADNLVEEVITLAHNILEEKHPGLSAKELTTRSKIIGMAALRFFILKFDPKSDFVYNPEESLSFEGETGPYILYTYARLSSIIKKSLFPKKAPYESLTEHTEKLLIIQLSRYPEIMQETTEKFKPSLLTQYLLTLAKLSNQYYHEHQILSSPPAIKAARLHLIKAISLTLKSGLSLLGMEMLEEM